jgi:hypothetical protein
VQSLAVITGRPDEDDRMDAGTLEGSADGITFERLARFASGSSQVQLNGRRLTAVRLRPEADLGHPLAIREFKIRSDPPVACFRYPIEFVVDASEAPEMADWAQRTARLCERAYPLINDALKSNEAFKPAHRIWLTMKSQMGTTAAAAVRDDHIIGSVEYFKKFPDDVGAIVFTTINCVQSYRTPHKASPLRHALAGYVELFTDESEKLVPLRLDQCLLGNLFRQSARLLAYLVEYDDRNPRWLVYGIADYVRFFKYEPGKLEPLDPERARYDGSYRITAAFLAFLTERYDRDIVRKLNEIIREGEYREQIFQQLTGKALPELDEEWRTALRRDRGLRSQGANPN